MRFLNPSQRYPNQKHILHHDATSLYLEFTHDQIEDLFSDDNTEVTLRAYFMDVINSPRLYPDVMEMTDEVSLVKASLNHVSTFETKIIRSHHISGDPNLDCFGYTEEDSYHDCIQKELLDMFQTMIGCAPPLLTKDQNTICNKTFNLSQAEDEKVKQIFRQIFFHNMPFNCRDPCTKNVYRTKLTHRIPRNGTSLVITFNSKINIVRTKFSTDGQTLLARLGGSVSSGRTLLWMLLSLLGIGQVTH